MNKEEFIRDVGMIDFGGCPHCLLKTVMQIWIDLNEEEIEAADLSARASHAGPLIGHETSGAIIMAHSFVKALSEVLIEGGSDVRTHSAVMVHTGHLLMNREQKICAEGATAADMLTQACGGVR